MKGHIQQLGPDHFRLYVPVGRMEDGRRRQLTETFHGPRKQADARLARMIVEADEGRTGTADITVSQLLERWLRHLEARKRSPWTLRGYRSKIDIHIKPHLGDLRLRKLTGSRLDAFYDEMLTRGAKPRGRRSADTPPAGPMPLSPQSVKHLHAILHAACEQGRRWELLDRNPADRATPIPVDQIQSDAPTVEDVLKVLADLTPKMRDLAVMAVVTAARRGELCGLQWADLKLARVDDDLPVGDLTIRRAIADPPHQPIVVKATKTNKVRRLALDSVTVAMLAARRARDAEDALLCGVPFERDGYIFSDTAGNAEPIRPQLVTKRWADAAARAGVTCRLHDLRHFSITELLEAGFEVAGVSKRAGHARTSITQDRYQHARRAGDLPSSEHLSKLLQPPG